MKRVLIGIGLLVVLGGCSILPGTQANADRKLGAAMGNNAKVALGAANDFADCIRRHMLEQNKGFPMAESVDHAFAACRNSRFPGHPWPENFEEVGQSPIPDAELLRLFRIWRAELPVNGGGE